MRGQLGSSGKDKAVFEAVDEATQARVAIACFHRDKGRSIQTEAKQQRRAAAAGVAPQLIEIIARQRRIVMELMTGGTLVDVAKRRYANELRLFGGNARVTLEATFEGSNEELRVTFRSIRLVLFGNQIFEKQFPPGVERTWCLSYTDASCRVVRAGVDGGRSIVREAGLVAKNAGEAKDAYLFFMERAPDYVAD